MTGLVIGLTGGIGSGKSVAADHFAVMGAAIIDADAIAHELTTADGAAMAAIEQAFGGEVLAADRSLDRAAMRRLVFADPEKRHQLESILHPMIRSVSEVRQTKALNDGALYVVMVVPLLAEADKGSRDRFDRIVVVDCPEELQIKRVMARNGLAEAEVKAILATQASRQQRLDVADDVVVNDGKLADLHSKVSLLHDKFGLLAAKMRA